LAQNAAENIPVAYAKIGKTAESESAYTNLLSRAKDPAQRAGLLIQAAQIKEKSGNAAEAIKYYEQVDPSVPEYSAAIYSIGNIHAQAGQSDMEIKAYEKLISVSKKDDPYRLAGLSRMAELYIAQGNAKKAMELYSDVAKNATDQETLTNAKSRLDELQKVLNQ
jgi:tetratricopeptide (TPR) repeat protein